MAPCVIFFIFFSAMAPCVIWHTPLRVKIAANLPHELRAEIKDDEAFVQVVFL
jgi:hypothetical protein